MNASASVIDSFAQWPGPRPEIHSVVRPDMLSWITDKHLSLLAPVAVYWVMSFFFYVIDKYQIFERYRIHTTEELNKNIVSLPEVLRAVFSQHIIQTAAGLILEQLEEPNTTGHEPYIVWKIGKNLGVSKPVATFMFQFVFPAFRLFIAFFIIDTWQYLLHRFMHSNKWAYRNMHSVHHRLYVPYAFGALYNSLAEGFLLDTLGTGVASVLVGLSDRENLILFVFSTMKTVDDHCGYEFPWDPLQIIFPNRATYHDIHHQQFGIKTNFSQPFFVHWDTLLGTKYAQTEEYILKNKKIRQEGFNENSKKKVE